MCRYDKAISHGVLLLSLVLTLSLRSNTITRNLFFASSHLALAGQHKNFGYEFAFCVPMIRSHFCGAQLASIDRNIVSIYPTRWRRSGNWQIFVSWKMRMWKNFKFISSLQWALFSFHFSSHPWLPIFSHWLNTSIPWFTLIKLIKRFFNFH